MHDRNGTPLRVGDIVLVPVRVTALQPGEDYCNLSGESMFERKPDHAVETFNINTAVVVLCDRDLDATDTQRV
jgi:hypothetical protein